MLPENITAIIARNESWSGHAATEPYEAGWAHEAVIFARALKTPKGVLPKAVVEISPDGIHWTAEGTTLSLPEARDELTAAKLSHFGGWLRLSAELPEGSEITVLVTLHLKA
ncbi:hypothetical protein [Martelella radicis]|uniref:Uncharacterized protein n=1 Tax=Martelella radicis TaxID=1397476 RepID=A0A7W6KIP6_9HYPH|nr:hypothetical protein [Martelella radicis]MBB4122039.1 hypothetical protein [Martelella radicis]